MKSSRKMMTRNSKRKAISRAKQNHIMGPITLAHQVELSNVRRSKRIADRKYPHESDSVIFVGTVPPISSTFSLSPSESSVAGLSEYTRELRGDHDEEELEENYVIFNADENIQEQLMQLEIVFEMQNNEASHLSHRENAVAGAGDNSMNTVTPVRQDVEDETEHNEPEGTLFQDLAAYIFSVFGDDNTSTPNADR